LSIERKELLVSPHTFWKVIRLGQEQVKSIWMLIDELLALKLAEEKEEKEEKR